MNALDDRIAVHIPRMEGWCTIQKGQRMAQAVADSRCDISVELGIFGGRGVISLAMAHHAIGHGVAWGFDPWTVAASVEGGNDPENDAWWAALDMEKIYKGFVSEVITHDLLSHCFWARLRSDVAVRLFEDESIGVLHCDSNHSEPISCQDVELWTPKIKPGGYWFADDTGWPTMKKAQLLILEKGFQKIEEHENWAVYQKSSS